MKVVIKGISVEGSPEEVYALIRQTSQEAVAKEVGISGLPLFDQPAKKLVEPWQQRLGRRRGQYKLVVHLDGGRLKRYYDLKDFYEYEHVEKKRISPCRRMTEEERIAAIAKNIRAYFKSKNDLALEVCMYRNRKVWISDGETVRSEK